MKYRVGIDIGGTKIAYGLFDEQFKLVDKKLVKFQPQLPDLEMLDVIADDVRALAQYNSLELADIAGVGVVIPGHSYFDKGLLVSASNLPTFHNTPVRDYLAQNLGVKVLFDNDANGAALAEHRLGAGKGKKDMIYITISTGIGAGIIINNAVFRGTYGASGELGHVMMTENPNICGCGHVGCIEAVGAGTGMAKLARTMIANGYKSVIPELAGGFEKIDPKSIYEAFRQGDAVARRVFDDYADYMGKFFYNLYQIFNLDTVVYGGGVTKIGPDLMDRIIERFKYYTPLAGQFPMDFIPAHFSDDVGLFGAALLID